METLDFYSFLLPSLFFVCFYSSRFSFPVDERESESPEKWQPTETEREKRMVGWFKKEEGSFVSDLLQLITASFIL